MKIIGIPLLQVNESEREKIESSAEHKRKYKAYQKSEAKVQQLQKNLKRSINKSRLVKNTTCLYV